MLWAIALFGAIAILAFPALMLKFLKRGKKTNRTLDTSIKMPDVQCDSDTKERPLELTKETVSDTESKGKIFQTVFFCYKCGKAIGNHMAFCPFCGNPTAGNNTKLPRQRSKQSNFNHKRKIIIAICLIAVIAVIAIGGIFIYRTTIKEEYSYESPESAFKVFVQAVNENDYDLASKASSDGLPKYGLDIKRLYTDLATVDFKYSNFVERQDNGTSASFNVVATITKNGTTKTFNSGYENIRFIKIGEDWKIDTDSALYLQGQISDMITSMDYD